MYQQTSLTLIKLKLQQNSYQALFCLIFLALTQTSLCADTPPNTSGKTKHKTNIYTFGPGIHEVDKIVLYRAHGIIEGAGKGVTILKVKRGLNALGPNPIIRNLTIVGSGKDTGILLSNSWSAVIQDVEIENYETGIKIELSTEGRIRAGGKTLNRWPSAMTKDTHWGSRVTLTEIRGVEITGPGNGIVLENKLKKTRKYNYWKPTNENRQGEFINATTIFGGHIGVNGTAIKIGDGVYSTKIFGTYLDISPAGGIVMDYGARGLVLVGASLDLNTAARKEKTPRIVAPSRARKSIQITGTTPVDFYIHYTH